MKRHLGMKLVGNLFYFELNNLTKETFDQCYKNPFPDTLCNASVQAKSILFS